MKKIPFKRIIAAGMMIGAMTLTTVYADVTQDDINNAKNQIDDLKDQKEDAQNEVNDITDKKNNLEADLNRLNSQMTEITASLNELDSKIADKKKELAELSNEIEQTKESLERAEEQSARQYEDMKKRIQFMYEKGSTSLLDMFFSASSIPDFLNKSEYISELNQYDRKKLQEFVAVQDEIAKEQQELEEQEKQLEDEQEKLLGLQADMKEKKDEVNSLISSTQQSISQVNTDLNDAKDKVDDIDSQIAEMEEYEKQLEVQKAKEDAARMEEIKRQEAENKGVSFTYTPDDSDLYLLGAIIQCESDGEPYEGKLAVGSVVLNRVKSSHFPNTVSGVIYQSGQFSPVASGRYALRLQQGVNSTCMQAAQEVLNGNITTDALFFRTNNGIVQGTVIGHHVFY